MPAPPERILELESTLFIRGDLLVDETMDLRRNCFRPGGCGLLDDDADFAVPILLVGDGGRSWPAADAFFAGDALGEGDGGGGGAPTLLMMSLMGWFRSQVSQCHTTVLRLELSRNNTVTWLLEGTVPLAPNQHSSLEMRGKRRRGESEELFLQGYFFHP